MYPAFSPMHPACNRMYPPLEPKLGGSNADQVLSALELLIEAVQGSALDGTASRANRKMLLATKLLIVLQRLLLANSGAVGLPLLTMLALKKRCCVCLLSLLESAQREVQPRMLSLMRLPSLAEEVGRLHELAQNGGKGAAKEPNSLGLQLVVHIHTDDDALRARASAAPLTLQLAPGDKVGSAVDKIASAWELESSTVRLWDYYSQSRFGLLADLQKTLEASKVCAGQDLLVECQQQSGDWAFDASASSASANAKEEAHMVTEAADLTTVTKDVGFLLFMFLRQLYDFARASSKAEEDGCA